MQWYYALADQRYGPVSETEFERLVAEGRIQAGTLVWRDGMAAWAPLSAVRGPVPPPLPAMAEGETEICAVSGRRYPKREMIQYDGQWISEEHREEYFRRKEAGRVTGEGLAYGSFGARVGAKCLDHLILAVVCLPLMGSIVRSKIGDLANISLRDPDALRRLQEPENMRRILEAEATALFWGALVTIVYTWVFVQFFRATPGKLAAGLAVVRSDGSKMSPSRNLARVLAEPLSFFSVGIGYLLAAFDATERRTLHDMICDTRVIRTRRKK